MRNGGVLLYPMRVECQRHMTGRELPDAAKGSLKWFPDPTRPAVAEEPLAGEESPLGS